MKYMGSKNRHAKYILPHLIQHINNDTLYIEPFVGGANMIDKIQHHKRFASDINPWLSELWTAVSDGWMPPESGLTEDLYNRIRQNKDHYPPELVGYVGFALSYGGKWFGGWCRDKDGKRDYVTEAYRNAVKQFPKLRGIQVAHGHYLDIDVPSGSVVYCDPPYLGTTKYDSDFYHETFYNWCRKLHSNGIKVYVSEYNMPDDFVCVWSKQVTSSLTADTGAKTAIEKLFTIAV